MEPKVLIDVQVNFIPSETVLIHEIYTSPQEKAEDKLAEDKLFEHIMPNLTGIDFSSVPPLAFVTPM